MGKIGEDRMGDWITFIEQQSGIIKERDGVKAGEKRGRFYKTRIEERAKIGERRVKGNVTTVLQQFRPSVLTSWSQDIRESKMGEQVGLERRMGKQVRLERGWENRLYWREEDGRTG
jgi:hypothetical protein